MKRKDWESDDIQFLFSVINVLLLILTFSCLALILTFKRKKSREMIPHKMTQSEINALAEDSDPQSSAFKDSQLESRVKQIPSYQVKKDTHTFQQSNPYGDEQFQDFQQSKKASVLNHNKQQVQAKGQKSSIYDSYANEQFDSYDESRRTKQFERSQQHIKFNKKSQAKELKPIQEITGGVNKSIEKKIDSKNTTTKKSPDNSKTASIPKPKNNNLIKQAPKPKNKPPLITSTDFNENKNLPYNYNRLQQRQKQLLMTTLSEENKKLRQLNAEKEKQLATVKGKYNILLQEKAHIMGNAKEATLKKQLQELQKKYDVLLKQRTQQRAYKTIKSQMSKTAANNFVSIEQAQQRESQLLVIVQKLKQRLVSTDKQLKTLQQKMNQGLDYQQQLHRKLKRVQQLQLRMQKMKMQAEQDRGLIDILKQKNKQQKSRIQQLQEQKNELVVCLKRADMNQATQSDLKVQLQQVRRQKEMLQKSLKEMSMGFSRNVGKGSEGRKTGLREEGGDVIDVIQDSNQLLSWKK